MIKDRVYGPNLMMMTCEAAAKNNIPIFLFGTTSDILNDLAQNLVKRLPELKIAGKLPSKFRTVSDTEQREIIEFINSSGAGITLVGLGCPRQEVWAYEFKDHIKMPVLAVGAAFNSHAGVLAQAPDRLQRLGLVWLYRLIHEPRRLWRRYVLLNPFYVGLVLLQWTGLKKFNPDSTELPKSEINYG